MTLWYVKNTFLGCSDTPILLPPILFKTIVSILDIYIYIYISQKERLMIGNKLMWCFCLPDNWEASSGVSNAAKPFMLCL